MKKRVRAILIEYPEIRFNDVMYDSETGTANEKGLVRFSGSKYDVDSKDFFTGKNFMGFRKTHVVIDVNGCCSLPIDARQTLDAEASTKLNVLSESSFWQGMRGMKMEWKILVPFMFAGVGVYQFLKLVMATFGVILP